MAYEIDLNLAPDVGYDAFNQLTIHGPGLVVLNDGIYFNAPKGDPGDGGEGIDKSDDEGVNVGYSSPFTTKSAIGAVTCTCYVHRLFDAINDPKEGIILTNFSKYDCALIGDMFRIKQDEETYTYYLITGTQKAPRDAEYGSYITTYEELGRW